jgi:hypothetical protein
MKVTKNYSRYFQNGTSPLEKDENDFWGNTECSKE